MASSVVALTPGVWECRNCRAKNLRKLACCTRCDCVNPEILSPSQPSPKRYPSTTTTNGLSTGPQQPFHHDTVLNMVHNSESNNSHSERRQPVERMLLTHTAGDGTPPYYRPRFSPSPTRTSPSRTAVVADTNHSDNQIYQGSGGASSSVRRVEVMVSPSDERSSLRVQLSQAVVSHKELMKEYAQLNTICDRNEEIIDRLRKDLSALDSVYKANREELDSLRAKDQSSRQVRDEEREQWEKKIARLEREVKDRENMWQGQRDVSDRFQHDHRAALDDLRAKHDAERQAWNDRYLSLERDLNVLRADYRTVVEAQSKEAQDQRASFAQERERYVEVSQQLVKDINGMHEKALTQMSEELGKTKELSSMLAHKERQMLLERIEHEQHMRYDVEKRTEKECKVLQEENVLQRASIEHLTKQRDELVSEATFQLEIVSELRTERAACKAELAALRASHASDHHRTFNSNVDVSTNSNHISITSLSAPRVAPVSPPAEREEDIAVVVATATRRLEEALAAETSRADALSDALDALRSEMLDGRQTLHDKQESLVAKEVYFTEEIKRLSAELANVKADLEDADRELKEETEAHQETKRQMSEEADAAQTRINNSQRQVEHLHNAIADQQKENERIVEECDALRVSLEEMEQTLADALAANEAQ